MQRGLEMLGLRERKKRDRREALICASQDLVLERGLDHVTVDEICAAVGVSARTFFNYFRSKDDAVLGIGQDGIAEEVARVFAEGGPTGDVVTDLLHAVETVLDAPELSASRTATAFELTRSDPRLLAHHLAWMEQQKAGLERLIEERRALAPFPYDATLLSALVLTVTRAAYDRWDRDGRPGSVGAYVPGVLDGLRAILAP